MTKHDRGIVMSRRRALMLAAAATSVTTGCPKRPPPPHVCLSIAFARQCHDEHVVFSASLTTLDGEATALVDDLATHIASQELDATLSVFVFDDGHAEAANELNAARLETVRAALVERGVASSRVRTTPIDPQDVRMAPATWQALTGDEDPLPLSGLVAIDC